MKSKRPCLIKKRYISKKTLVILTGRDQKALIFVLASEVSPEAYHI